MLNVCVLSIVISAFSFGQPQSCNPAVVDYLVRDEQGRILTQKELESVIEGLPKSIGDAQVGAGEVSFAADRKTYYWPESVDFPKGNKQPALEFANAATCTMHLTELTLTLHGKKMRLIFNRELPRTDPGHRLVIDSLPFRSGTFMLDLEGWSGDLDKLIPANRWKRIKQPN